MSLCLRRLSNCNWDRDQAKVKNKHSKSDIKFVCTYLQNYEKLIWFIIINQVNSSFNLIKMESDIRSRGKWVLEFLTQGYTISLISAKKWPRIWLYFLYWFISSMKNFYWWHDLLALTFEILIYIIHMYRTLAIITRSWLEMNYVL